MRLIARFAQEKEDFYEVITVYDEKINRDQLPKKAPVLISISKEYPSAIWFERKMRDDFGIAIIDNTDNRSLIKNETLPKNTFPMRKDFTSTHIAPKILSTFNDSLDDEVIIGPTHRYHLESSGFKFSKSDEKKFDFEMIIGYKYRAIEKQLEGLTLDAARDIIERISASQSIAYQIAFLDIKLQSTKKTLPDMIKKRHLFLLELERVVNYLTDLAGLCQLVEFYDGAKFFMRHVDLGRKAMKKLTGSRFGFSSIKVDAHFLDADDAYEFLLLLEKELDEFEKWIVKRDKIFEKTLLLGQISKEKVIEYGLVGIMARCSYVALDRRANNNLFLEQDYFMNREEAGDTFARFNIRVSEIFTSIRMMKHLVKKDVLPFYAGTVTDGEYYSYVESSSGEVMMYIALKDGIIERFFLRDPSFLNAQALPTCIKKSEISDLNLIIKSIPLNVSAIDL